MTKIKGEYLKFDVDLLTIVSKIKVSVYEIHNLVSIHLSLYKPESNTPITATGLNLINRMYNINKEFLQEQKDQEDILSLIGDSIEIKLNTKKTSYYLFIDLSSGEISGELSPNIEKGIRKNTDTYLTDKSLSEQIMEIEINACKSR